MFDVTREKTSSLEQEQVLEIGQLAGPSAFVDAGRNYYVPIVESELAAYLKHTEVDRYIWREAQPKADTAEMVCASFSLLLWALLEQERLKQRIFYPFAVARVRLATHSLCGFINENSEFKFIEPQNDRIYKPDMDIQTITFL